MEGYRKGYELVKGSYKKFDKTLYDKNDKKAKQIVISFLKSIWDDVCEYENQYGPDIIVDRSFFVEVEIKQNWDKIRFPFSTVNIPERKKKYLDYGLPVVYLILSKDYRRAISVRGEDLKDEYLREVPNRFVSSGELFFQVPVTKCSILNNLGRVGA